MNSDQHPSLQAVNEAIAAQVQKELDALPSEHRHLVVQQMQRPLHSGSVHEVRTLAAQLKNSSMG